VTGPFRLALSPERVRLDTAPDDVIAALTISPSTRIPGFQHVEAAFKFSEHYWRGVNDFHVGKLSESLNALREAAAIASTPHHRLAASFYIERILERHGEMEEAEDIRRKTRVDLEAAGRYQAWAKSRDLVLAAWREYRDDRVDSAEALYRKALEPAQRQGLFEVLGEIHNGLGEIAKRRGQYQEALRHYLEALDVWLVADYFYGFQAVYFNIGVLYRLWGDELRQGRHPRAARLKYESAAQWTERCSQLCRGMDLGFDTSEAEAQLASLYLKLGRFGKALTIALSAKQIAFRARNQRSILASMRVLAAAYLVRNEPEEAITAVRESSESLTERFRNVLADQIGKFLR